MQGERLQMHVTKIVKDTLELLQQAWQERKTLAVMAGVSAFAILYKSPIVFR
jgi:hypothetical protein